MSRTQYPFGGLTADQRKSLIGLNKPLRYIIMIQEQWDTFERVENYNDQIYQKFLQGDRSQLYYQFRTDQELHSYRAGQQLHVNAYPNLPASTFQPIRDRPMPDVPIRTALPIESGPPRFAINRIIPTASELAAQQADLAVYTYVSTYNATHQIKYNFVDDLEKNAYERTELRLNAIP